MVISGIDSHNVSVVIGVYEAKMLVEILRKIGYSRDGYRMMIEASNKVNEAGFETLGTDVDAVVRQVALAIGFWTDKLVKIVPGEAVPEGATPVETPVDGEEVVEEPKPTVN